MTIQRRSSSRRRPRPAPVQHAPLPKSEPKVRALVPRNEASEGLRAFVAVSEHHGDYEPHRTQFHAQMHDIKAMTCVEPNKNVVLAKRSLAEARGYDREDLMVIAEVAYHYLFNGGTNLALTLYEGLAAVAPDEPYFAMALGLTNDHLGRVTDAHRWYAKAAQLDPADGRPDVNRAELYIEARDLPRARQYLARGANKAKQRGDEALRRKAIAVIRHLDLMRS